MRLTEYSYSKVVWKSCLWFPDNGGVSVGETESRPSLGSGPVLTGVVLPLRLQEVSRSLRLLRFGFVGVEARGVGVRRGGVSHLYERGRSRSKRSRPLRVDHY